MSTLAAARGWLRERAGRGGWAWARACLPGLALGLGAGLALCALLWGPALTEVWTVREALAQVPEPLPAPPRARPADEAMAPAWDGPGLGERDAAWLWLRQRLQAQGLRLEVLRPEAVQSDAVLASQPAQLRLQGAWADWASFGPQLLAHAPWWSWEQWHVQPAGEPGQVRVEARLRLWLAAGQTVHATRVWPQWPVPTALASPASPVLVSPFASGPQAPAAEPAQAAASAPSAAWRLWGSWTQAGQRHDVLGRGADWTLRPWPGGRP